jgi:protein subunit release factor A
VRGAMTGPGRDELAPPAEGAVVVSRSLVIPRTELRVRVSRAGGPGGQHVNTSSTRVSCSGTSPARAP